MLRLSTNLSVFEIQVVAGGGAVEAALSVYLEYLATTLGSREQLAIAEFAESLLIIPKVLFNLWVHDTHVLHPIIFSFENFIEVSGMCLLQVLAVNAAKDATELVAKLRAYHHTAQTKADKKHLSRYSVCSSYYICLVWNNQEKKTSLKQKKHYETLGAIFQLLIMWIFFYFKIFAAWDWIF